MFLSLGNVNVFTVSHNQMNEHYKLDEIAQKKNKPYT